MTTQHYLKALKRRQTITRDFMFFVFVVLVLGFVGHMDYMTVIGQ